MKVESILKSDYVMQVIDGNIDEKLILDKFGSLEKATESVMNNLGNVMMLREIEGLIEFLVKESIERLTEDFFI